MTRAAVIGAGSWGTSFAQVLVDAGTDTIVCGRRAELADAINDRHENPDYLPGNLLPYVVALVCFAAGAAAGGRLVRRDGETGRRIGFASDAGLIGVAAVIIALTHPGPAGQARYLVIGILAVAMGMQNVLIRRWGILDLATNAMTKTMAYLAADSPLGGGDNHHAMRRSTSIVIFAAGAAAGAFLSRYGVLWPILTSFTLFVLALPILLQPPGQQPGG